MTNGTYTPFLLTNSIKTHKIHHLYNINCYICRKEWFRMFVQALGLKGNQVKILNSPAAVSSIQPSCNNSCH